MCTTARLRLACSTALQPVLAMLSRTYPSCCVVRRQRVRPHLCVALPCGAECRWLMAMKWPLSDRRPHENAVGVGAVSRNSLELL